MNTAKFARRRRMRYERGGDFLLHDGAGIRQSFVEGRRARAYARGVSGIARHPLLAL